MQNNWDTKVDEFSRAIFEAVKDACDKGSEKGVERARELLPDWEKTLKRSLNRWDITEAMNNGEIPDMIEFMYGPDEEISRRGPAVEFGDDPRSRGHAFLLPSLELSRDDIMEMVASNITRVRNND